MLGSTDKEKDLFKLFDGKRVLYDVISDSPLPPEDSAKLLYAFHVLELICLKDSQLKITLPNKQNPFQEE
ncbi:MAG: hypothetical protein A2Y62_10930 [Candidatus Fischerbacteria bacterium RBG_13_37_8]|uniref:Uncharacterized protein n=1 Tax=Candidatus Fischerbacteria bacterium RBG_13_37_8 TaxID=1817863 RepID=A0A1F5VVF2_9BACT|nr:MAG: hypothetical protein A2Y62_10930 [Candidatus Fischerbacteria bacterium RBG_13_37_8]